MYSALKVLDSALKFSVSFGEIDVFSNCFCFASARKNMHLTTFT